MIVEAIIFKYQKSKVVDKGLALEVGKYSNGAFSAFNSSDLVDLASVPVGLVAPLHQGRFLRRSDPGH